jgi:uncharacterized membrane protein
MELKLSSETVIISVAIAEAIYTWTQVLKKLLENNIIKWLLTLLGHPEWAKIFPIFLSIINGYIAFYLTYGQDGFTVQEIILLITTIFGANVQHYELRKLGNNQ